MTFIATANTILHCGAKPVFVDVEADTGNIDAGRIAAAITERTKAVMPVHLYGLMADMRDVGRGMPPAPVATCWRTPPTPPNPCATVCRPGNLGHTSSFSFYATKNLTCGEGGAIATNDSALNDKLRWLRLHGMSKSAADRYTGTYQHWDMIGLGLQGEHERHPGSAAPGPASAIGKPS